MCYTVGTFDGFGEDKDQDIREVMDDVGRRHYQGCANSKLRETEGELPRGN